MLALHVLAAPGLILWKVVKQRAAVAVVCKDPKHFKPGSLGHLLRVARVGDGLSFVVFEADLAQLAVGDVFDKDPAHVKHAVPALGFLPERQPSARVDIAFHRSHPTERSARVHAEKEVHGRAVLLAERAVESLVADVRARPHGELDAHVHVILAERLDHKESCPR